MYKARYDTLDYEKTIENIKDRAKQDERHRYKGNANKQKNINELNDIHEYYRSVYQYDIRSSKDRWNAIYKLVKIYYELKRSKLLDSEIEKQWNHNIFDFGRLDIKKGGEIRPSYNFYTYAELIGEDDLCGIRIYLIRDTKRINNVIGKFIPKKRDCPLSFMFSKPLWYRNFTWEWNKNVGYDELNTIIANVYLGRNYLYKQRLPCDSVASNYHYQNYDSLKAIVKDYVREYTGIQLKELEPVDSENNIKYYNEIRMTYDAIRFIFWRYEKVFDNMNSILCDWLQNNGYFVDIAKNRNKESDNNG